MQKSNILWCTHTWNPVIGCPLPLASTGCAKCYARKLHNGRHKAYLAGKKLPKQYAKPFKEIQLFSDRLNDPIRCRAKDAKIFIGSMTDLFHKDVPFEFIDKVMYTIYCSYRLGHTFQILTKRPKIALRYFQGNYLERILKSFPNYSKELRLTRDVLSKNLWLGTSISTHADLEKAWLAFKDIPAAIKFFSIEPLLEDIYLPGPLQDHGFGYDFNQKPESIDWVIVGCESGPKQRPCKIEWILDIIRHCKIAEIPVFVKQVPINGKCNKKPEEWPKKYRIQEYPTPVNSSEKRRS